MKIGRGYIWSLLFVLFFAGSAFGQKKMKDRVLKSYKYGDFQSIMKSAEDMQPDDVALQFRMYAQGALEYGAFEKAVNFYQKAALLNKSNFQEKDVIGYYYSLLKCKQEDRILSDTLFTSFKKTSKTVRLLYDDANSRSYYWSLKYPGIKAKELLVDGIIPRYGFSFNDYYLYFAYQKGTEKEGDLTENYVFASRMFDMSKVAKIRINSTGSLGSEGPVIYNSSRSKKYVTLYKPKATEDEFLTMVPGNGAPERIEIQGRTYPDFPYNSLDYACAMPYLDETSKRLYFCSTMKGGYGGWDIYYVELDGNRWGNPINAGNMVNTPFDELFPTIYAGLVCFSSDGWEGFGGFDNYAYNPQEDTRMNLMPFNGKGDDYSFQLIEESPVRAVGILDQKPVFFSSSKEFTELVKEVNEAINFDQPQEIARKILAEAQSAPASSDQETTTTTPAADASLDLAEAEVLKEMGAVTDDPTDYALLDDPKPLKSATTSKDKAFVPDIATNEVTTSVVPTSRRTRKLGEIYFDSNSPIIKGEYYAMLDKLVERIQHDDLRYIVVWGHADRSGDGRYNDYLSYQRAQGVVEYLRGRLAADNKRRFFTIAAGEEYAKGIGDTELDDRKVVINQGNRELPYSTIYAHRALPGQSLADVAKQFCNDLEMLKQMNAVTYMPESRLLLVGIQGIYLVKQGDTLNGIARMFHCSNEILQRLNRKPAATVHVGEKLIIPLSDLDKQ